MDCPKCGGSVDRGKERDFYTELNFLKCLNCGKTVYFRPIKLNSNIETVPEGKLEFSRSGAIEK